MERIGIVGGGAIASGLACIAAERGEVLVWARRPDAASAKVQRLLEKLGSAAGSNISFPQDLDALCDATFVVEAIVEEHDAKSHVLGTLGARAANDTILATTTSALSVSALAEASGRPERFVGLHVFNPVPKMDLVELVFPGAADEATRARARTLCSDLGKTPVEVLDTPGFVVNRLLFPYLFDAVTLLDETRLEPSSVDACMTMGAGHPMGPLALLDYVGLDVAAAIGQSIGVPPPPRIEAMVREGALGKKAGRGFYVY